MRRRNEQGRCPGVGVLSASLAAGSVRTQLRRSKTGASRSSGASSLRIATAFARLGPNPHARIASSGRLGRQYREPDPHPNPRSESDPVAVNALGGLLKQPLPYFVLLGAMVFIVDLALRGRSESDSSPLDATGEVRARLEQRLARPPTNAELARGLEEWLDTELLFREAMALGLDQNDSVIREHLAQKLEHIVRERSVPPPASEAELEARLAAEPSRYTAPETFDIAHAFVLEATNPQTFEARVDAALAQLTAGDEPEEVGDHFPRGPKFAGMTRPQLESILKTGLAEALQPSRRGQWQVVKSARGAHLIRLDAVHSGKPDFRALRPALEADVLEQKKQAALRAYLEGLRQKYQLDVGRPP